MMSQLLSASLECGNHSGILRKISPLLKPDTMAVEHHCQGHGHGKFI
jgi:hypothetical protein